MTAVEKLLSVAKAEVGYHETGENITKYATDYDYDTKLYGFDMNGSPWCDFWVDWCFIEAFGYDLAKQMTYQFDGCSGAACSASASYYQSHGAFFQTPEVGDQIFFNYSGGINHTGIVSAVNGNIIKTIEGNSSDQVKENTYNIATSTGLIAGYGRPKWSLASGNYEGTTSASTLTNTNSVKVSTVVVTDEVSAGNTRFVYMNVSLPVIKPIHANSKCEAVKVLQAILNEKGNNLAVDGMYGSGTQTAVSTWQTKHGLTPDMEVGANTWKSLITEQ